RLSPGTTWVSHLLQRITHALLRDEDTRELLERAGAHYAERNLDVARRLSAAGLPVTAGDGLNLWLPVAAPARDVAEQLMRRGWLVRTGDEFRLADDGVASRHLRLTVHDLTAVEVDALVADLAAVVAAAPRTS